jgi:anti-anti-sigma factor
MTQTPPQSSDLPAFRRLDVSQVGGVSVACLKGPTISEAAAVQDLGRELLQWADATAGGKLLVDFSSVEMLAPAAMGKFLLLAKKIKARSGVLRLSGLRPAIYNVFAMNKLLTVFEVFENRAEALASFGEQTPAE